MKLVTCSDQKEITGINSEQIEINGPFLCFGIYSGKMIKMKGGLNTYLKEVRSLQKEKKNFFVLNMLLFDT
jgi:hypothetical protein